MNKVYDCFLLFNELKMLNLRLNELNDVVDFFVIVESNSSFVGNSKAYFFEENINLFEKFKHKIIYLKWDLVPSSDPWQNEVNQRNFFSIFFKNNQNINDNDIIMLSDVDEIPDTKIITQIKENAPPTSILTFNQNLYYYNHWTRANRKWPGTVATTHHIVKNQYNYNFQQIRKDRCTSPHLGNENDYSTGGWHFSYFGDETFIINKIKNFSHQEYNTEQYTSSENIKKAILEGKDLFFRDYQTFTVDKNASYLPKFVYLLD
jgi:beta-1,4-mannosyl-glycoprotein beta-1,4-N-acetylglucosaminyltransferase